MVVPKGCGCAEVVKDARRGRYWRAGKKIPKGSVVHAEKPLYLSLPYQDKLLYTLPWELTMRIVKAGDHVKYGRKYILKTYLSHPELVTNTWENRDEEICQWFERQISVSREDLLKLHVIVVTNNLLVDGPEGQRCGFYKWFSMLNHSCEANAKYVTADYARGEISLVATREIATGEEITTSYVDFSEDPGKALRQAVLKSQYGFLCQCNKCNKYNKCELK